MSQRPPGFDEEMGEGEDRSGQMITIALVIAGPLLILIGYLIGTGAGEAKEYKEVQATIESTSVRGGRNQVSIGSGGASSSKSKYYIYADVTYEFGGKGRKAEYKSMSSFSSFLAASAYASKAFAKGSKMTVYVHPSDPHTIHSTNYQWVEPLSLVLQFVGVALFCGALFKLAS